MVEISSGERLSINHDGWLTIENVILSDLGTYQVNISNNMDFAIHTVHLELAVGGETTAPASTQPRYQSHFGK